MAGLFRWKRLRNGVLALAGLALASQPAQAFWPFTPDIDIEDVYYDQFWLLESQLEELAPDTPGKRDLYVIGVAGHGTQDLFLREIEEISALVAEHYNTTERTILLVNNKETLDTYPLANQYNLDAAAAGIAQVMNVDEDVLLLVMTSHGSPGRFSTWFPPLYPKSLKPHLIRGGLDDVGIKNRVIIIQACFSGSFISGLEDPDTLIITAARADRASFGCSDDREWTYFNQAYFDEAFRTAPRFIEAFAQARGIVSEWENYLVGSALFKPSLPQISIGENISQTLHELEIDNAVVRLEQARLVSPAR